MTSLAESPVRNKALKGMKPHERQRHETRPQGLVRIKPSRVWERPKREGVRVEPDSMPIHQFSYAEGARNLMGGAQRKIDGSPS